MTSLSCGGHPRSISIAWHPPPKHECRRTASEVSSLVSYHHYPAPPSSGRRSAARLSRTPPSRGVLFHPRFPPFGTTALRACDTRRLSRRSTDERCWVLTPPDGDASLLQNRRLRRRTDGSLRRRGRSCTHPSRRRRPRWRAPRGSARSEDRGPCAGAPRQIARRGMAWTFPPTGSDTPRGTPRESPPADSSSTRGGSPCDGGLVGSPPSSRTPR